MAVIMVAALVLPGGTVFAKGGPPGGGGGGGGGGGEGGHEPGGTNNLSVPTIMIGGGFTGVTCPGGLVDPTGTPLAGYEIDPAAYYFVQGTHAWQAECNTATSATATAEWGDNLAGDAKLQVGKPIRVELGLFDDTGLQMQGFTVVKLEPSKLDRESAYGTLATDDGLGGWDATAGTLPVRVFDSGVTFSVKNVATDAYVVDLGSNPTAEINATGKVVYGYNLRVYVAGEYEITFVIPSVDITGVDVGTYTTDPLGPDTVTLVINVIAGGGGGGGKGPGVRGGSVESMMAEECPPGADCDRDRLMEQDQDRDQDQDRVRDQDCDCDQECTHECACCQDGTCDPNCDCQCDCPCDCEQEQEQEQAQEQEQDGEGEGSGVGEGEQNQEREREREGPPNREVYLPLLTTN
ncbi:MAG: hypothetical protein KDD83_01120 [Caldilineaceae bacterium]|nr:hypothetical protein [Caldilineaceae bacterium]